MTGCKHAWIKWDYVAPAQLHTRFCTKCGVVEYIDDGGKINAEIEKAKQDDDTKATPKPSKFQGIDADIRSGWAPSPSDAEDNLKGSPDE